MTYRCLYGPAVDRIMARLGAQGDIAWYLGDHLGTVRDLADTSGQVIDHIAYDSFGGILAETNPAMGDRFKFTAREFDAAIEQYYYRARYYDGRTGRFTSEDPLGLAAGDANVFRYVLNRPTVATDPTGELMDTPGNGYYSSWGAAVLAQGAAAGTGAAAQYPPIEAFAAAESPSGPTPTPYVASAARAASAASEVRLKSAHLVAIKVTIETSKARGENGGKKLLKEILEEAVEKLTDVAELPYLPVQWQAATFGITVADQIFITRIIISGVFEVGYESWWRRPDPPRGPGGWAGIGGGTLGIRVELANQLLGDAKFGWLVTEDKFLKRDFQEAWRRATETLLGNPRGYSPRLIGLIKAAVGDKLRKPVTRDVPSIDTLQPGAKIKVPVIFEVE